LLIRTISWRIERGWEGKGRVKERHSLFRMTCPLDQDSPLGSVMVTKFEKSAYVTHVPREETANGNAPKEEEGVNTAFHSMKCNAVLTVTVSAHFVLRLKQLKSLDIGKYTAVFGICC
jgi:hypothetical protein